MGAEPCGPSPRRPDKRTRCSTWGSRDGRAFRRGVRRFPSGSCAQPAIRATVVRLFGLCFGFCAPPIRTAHIAQSLQSPSGPWGPLPPRNPGAGRGGTEQPPGRRRNPRGSAGTGTERVRTPYGLPTGYRRGRSPSSPVPSISHLSSDSRLFVSYSIHAARVPPRFRVVTTSCFRMPGGTYTLPRRPPAGGTSARAARPPARPRPRSSLVPPVGRRRVGDGVGTAPAAGSWTAAGEGVSAGSVGGGRVTRGARDRGPYGCRDAPLAVSCHFPHLSRTRRPRPLSTTDLVPAAWAPDRAGVFSTHFTSR